MAKVLVLPDHIASQIAAGEVVERPSSVVKELVENSIDAGASEIEIAISADCRDIRVADNGHGMEPEDAVLSFQRHATSKLRAADDLWTLSTLGFRGEALPSVASISKFTCYTRTHDAAAGTKITSSDGELKATETGCSPGTVMEVLDLFYNTPARLKFMKKAATEFGHIQEIVQSLAISYTDVAFTLINDGEVVMRTSGQAALDATIVESGFFSGREALVEVFADQSMPGLSIHGYLAKPIHFRGDRKGILTIVNKRAVRCPLTLKALDYAYSDLIPRGRYPLAVVKVQLDPGQVDVNIHPTKKELKYSNGNGLYLAIQRALTKALRQESIAYANARVADQQRTEQQRAEQERIEQERIEQERIEQQPFQQQTFEPQAFDRQRFEHQRIDQFDLAQHKQLETIALVQEESAVLAGQLNHGSHLTEARHQQDQDQRVDHAHGQREYGQLEHVEASQISFRDNLSYSVTEQEQHIAPYKRDIGRDAHNVGPGAFALSTSEHILAASGESESYELPAGWRMMGYLKNTYIFFETHEGLEIIEQHIAHERTLYERLLANQNSETPGILSQNVQQLVISAPLGLTADQTDVLRNCNTALTRLGFEFAFDDDGKPSVTQLPMQLARVNYVTVIQRMLEDIATADATNMELEATKSIACQSAIKNGMPLSQRDILKLVSDWLKTERRDTCPHGRPVRLKYSMPELFELFHPA
jgi:DNA mismatch repair protein MutL